MNHAYNSHVDCVERLLREPRVIETIDAQDTHIVTGIVEDATTGGDTALHLLCSNNLGDLAEGKQMLELLIYAGANPSILNDRQETPLDILRRRNPYNTMLTTPLVEHQRTFLLAKAREINDSNHAIAKAKEDAQRKVLAAAPPCLRGRVREQQQQLLLLGLPLPRVDPAAWSCTPLE